MIDSFVLAAPILLLGVIAILGFVGAVSRTGFRRASLVLAHISSTSSTE